MKLFRCPPATASSGPFFDKSLFTEESRFSAPWVFLTGCALWFLSHPYWRIWHDAQVYTLMALRWLTPSAFVRDPWFMFGSQDSYTIFSPLYAGLISLIGVEKAALLGTLAEGMLFVVACWILCRALPLKTGRYLVFLLLVSTQLVYCVNQYNYFASLRVSEPFITARNLSVALSLMGLGLAFLERKAFSWLLTLLAMAFHPLMGGWLMLLLVVWFLNLRTRTVWLLCIFGVYVLASLAFSDVGIFKIMSEQWAQYVRINSGVVFPHIEQQQRLGLYIAGYCLLHFAGRFGLPMLRQWYKWVLAISFSATLLFWFCSTHAPSALIMQLQLWRANWLALIFAVIAIVDLAKRAWLGGNPRRLISVTAGTIFLFSPLEAAPILLLCGSFPCQSLRFSQFILRRYDHRFWQALKVLLAVMLVLWLFYLLGIIDKTGMELVKVGADTKKLDSATNPFLNLSAFNILMGSAYTGANGLVPLLVWMLLATRFRPLVLAGVIVLTLVVVPFAWNTQLSRDNKLNYQIYKQFKTQVKRGEVVYWQQRPLAVYLSLQTANYVSKVHVIGIVFSEEKTREVARRLQRVALAGEDAKLITASLSGRNKAMIAYRHQKDEDFDPELLHTYEVKELSQPGLEYLCKDPELDYVIHEQLFPELVLAMEKDEIGEKKTWYLYGCRDVRNKQKTNCNKESLLQN